ncbi:MAG: 2OG-Fe dioxygenase family protein [Acidimicrobiales bacterium]
MHTILEQLLLTDVELKELRHAGNFDDLPVDPYTTGGYRSRRFARVKLDGHSLVLTPDQAFSQGTDVNSYLGGVVRVYEPVHDEFLSAPVVRSICELLAERAELADGTIGIHQIRISCSRGQEGSPAPEGVHRDGVRFVFICCVDRVDVVGARTQLFELSPGVAGDGPFFDEVLAEGACLLVNDELLAHYTSSISPTVEHGYRDALVVTIE